ncbi:LysR family transcriptional regulator [[Clostridium] polysaccharolyticum]|uniref:DNA-binding transcriptional regulator, LysR family n=1 Tax=[Clostridium] polysaccharolyticum TaxID=29364 RepID=A0A1H9YTA9_9FIRM|nr:LysR family transcriptional regulator [[Clostridium] polysaccharolyticum]SES72404.1 DNA-binding transcriptional regulator, LysR family [[Clostridium] polysaccharolyticum]
MDINYELYKVFYFVARTLSFSEASKELYISQSAVSQSIKTLEKRLDQTLFVRSTKKVKLTKEGELLFKHIEPAINLISRGENQIIEGHTLNGGQLRIGASDTICRYYLVPFFKSFHNRYPNVHIKIINETSLNCVDLLETNQVDLIIANTPNSKLNSLENVKTIHEFQDVFLVNTNYFTDISLNMNLTKLQSYPILMLGKNSTTSQFLHSIFLQNQLDLIPAIELSSNDLLIDLAKIGLGIAFVPDFCIKPDTNDLKVIQIKERLPKRKIVAAYSSQLPLSAAASYFLESLSFKDRI